MSTYDDVDSGSYEGEWSGVEPDAVDTGWDDGTAGGIAAPVDADPAPVVTEPLFSPEDSEPVGAPPAPDLLPPVPDVFPPTVDELPPVPDVLPPTVDELPPVPDVLPPTVDELPPVPDVLPPTVDDAPPDLPPEVELPVEVELPSAVGDPAEVVDGDAVAPDPLDELPVPDLLPPGDDAVGVLDDGAVATTSESLGWADVPVDPSDHPTPLLYESGTLVSQVPIASDLATVEDVTGSAVYQEWVRGAIDGGPIDGPTGVAGGLDGLNPFDRPGMVGDAGDVNFWFQQNSQFSCGPSSVAQIVSDFTGVLHVDESITAARAQQLGWYDPSSGMLPVNVARLLTDQGVPSAVHEYQDFGDVEQYLREGRAVVMFLDARDVMPATGYEDFVAADELENTPQDTVDHFVRVIGIDRVAGVAVLANPGFAGGAQFEIPLDRLEEAWNDNTIRSDTQIVGSKMLIVSEGGDPTPDDLQATPGAPAPQQPVTQPEVQLPGDPQPEFPQPEFPLPDDQPAPAGPATVPGDDVAGPGEPDREVRLGTAAATLEDAGSGVAGEVELGPRGEERPVGSGGSDDVTGRPAPRDAAGSARDTRVVSLPDAASAGLRPGAFPMGADPQPAALPEVSLPVDATGAAPPVTDVDPPADEARVADDDGLFESVPGWVLIPVTLAAARVGAALRRR